MRSFIIVIRLWLGMLVAQLAHAEMPLDAVVSEESMPSAATTIYHLQHDEPAAKDLKTLPLDEAEMAGLSNELRLFSMTRLGAQLALSICNTQQPCDVISPEELNVLLKDIDDNITQLAKLPAALQIMSKYRKEQNKYSMLVNDINAYYAALKQVEAMAQNRLLPRYVEILRELELLEEFESLEELEDDE